MKTTHYLATILFFCAFSISAFGQTDDNTRISNTISEISIYPQPSNGIINIKLSETQNENPIVAVFDLLGNKVAEIEAEHVNGNVYVINLEDKKAGYYFLKIQTDNVLVSRRITIK
jgi:hypothetical protein